MEKLQAIVSSANDVIWTYLLIGVLILCAVWFTVRTGFIQFRSVPEMFRLLAERRQPKEGKRSISSFQAFAVSIASRVGTGNLAGVATALRFISHNKLYTAIEVVGMAIALTFIIFIGTYVTQESSYDSFVSDNIYVGSDTRLFSLSGTVKGSVEDRFSDIEAICRLLSTKSIEGRDLTTSVGDETMVQNAICVDSNFLSLIPLPMAAGDGRGALEVVGSVLVSQSFANTWFSEGNAVGSSIDITAGGVKTSLTVTGIFEDLDWTVLPECCC